MTLAANLPQDGNNRGTIASLTLGGYDTMRFVRHDTTFSLEPVARLPTVRLRGVFAQVSSEDEIPTSNWTSTARTLVAMDDSITAVIDSSTPYLWLPTDVCDRFAAALNLTWREDLGVYVFSEGAQYLKYQSDTSLSFTFSLSSYHNADNFGDPYNIPGVVNITIPVAAFAQLLRYPFKDVIKWGQSSIPYFPLKRSTKEVNDNRYIIGRVFMQEAYIITSYDRGTFSLHQALFPDNAATNYSLEAITRPPDSPYPRFEGEHTSHNGLNPGQTAGIALSAFLTGSILGLILWFCCRRRRRARKAKPDGQEEENKDGTQVVEDEEPKSPVKRMFTMMIRRKKSRKPVVHETHGNSTPVVEVGTGNGHEFFEMPVPPGPFELDAPDLGDDDTDLGVDSTEGLSQYEIDRRKLDRKLQGPVPTYTPSAPTPPTAGQEKSMQDASPVAHYRPPSEPSPASSPTYANSNSLPNSLPSPMSPHGEWTNRMFDLPSPMTVAPPSHFPLGTRTGSDPSSSYSPVSPQSIHSRQTFAPSSITRSDSNNPSPTSPTGSMQLPTPTFQRTPIDPSRVICLGPLPENVQLPNQPSAQRVLGRSSQLAEVGPSHSYPPESPLPEPLGHYRSHTQDSSDTLGSNFTVEEENRLRTGKLTQQQSVLRQEQRNEQGEGNGMPRSPCSMERIEGGSELVHVPQVAERRYSWEQDGS